MAGYSSSRSFAGAQWLWQQGNEILNRFDNWLPCLVPSELPGQRFGVTSMADFKCLVGVTRSLILSLLLTVSSLAVAEEVRLSGEVAAILDAAAGHTDTSYLVIATTLAIAAAPETKNAILQYVEEIAPGRIASVLASAPEQGSDQADNNAPYPVVATPEDAVAQQPYKVTIGALISQKDENFEAIDDPDESDAPGWTGEVSISISNRTGDNDDFDAEGAIAATYDGKKWRHNIAAELEYEKNRGQTRQSDFIGSYTIDGKLSERFYMLVGARIKFEKFSGYDYRLSAFAGYGYSLLKGRKFNWDLEATPGIRFSRVDLTRASETEFVGRFTSDFTWAFSDTATITNVTIAELGTNSSTLENIVALTLRISERFSGRMSQEAEYESNPPRGAVNTNTKTKLSLVYGF